MTHFSCRLILWACLAIGCGSCSTVGTEQEGIPKEMRTARIQDIINAHSDEFLAMDGVVGLVESALDDGTPCIHVLVVKESEALRKAIPGELEGYPVFLLETGVIRPSNQEDK